MEGKSSTQCIEIVRFFTFCLLIKSDLTLVPGSEFQILYNQLIANLPFAVECDWKNKTSQNVQNLGFFEKVDHFFSKKKLHFLKTAKRVKMSFPP